MRIRLSILGAGFIGLNFIRSSGSEKFDITVLDRNKCPDDLVGKIKWIQGNFFSESILAEVITNANIVFHFISTTVPGDQVDEASELAVNVGQTLTLLKLCIKEKVKKVVFISSASVYGVKSNQPVSELALTNPISSHGITKLTIEKYFELYNYHYGLDCKILRLSNPYGPGQNIYGRQGFVAIAIGKILSGESIEICGDGNVIRDYIYIDDVSSVLNLLINTDSKENIFNIGSGIGYSLNDVILKLSFYLGKPINVMYAERRFFDIPSSILDVSKSINFLGHKNNRSFDEGLLLTLKHYKIKTTI